MRRAKLPGSDLALLLLNVLALGALLVLMALGGLTVPMVLLAVGAAGMAIAKLARAFSGPKDL